MSTLKEPTKVIYFLSFLYHENSCDKKSIYEELETKFGRPIFFTHDYFPMKEYYSKEMGEMDELRREFLLFSTPRDRNFLKNAKIFCTQMENKLLINSRRTVNLDPGYISLDQIILSTGKPYAHRIYLGDGVFSELTYRFSGDSFQTLDWTYPDYSHPQIIEFFNWSRQFLNFSK